MHSAMFPECNEQILNDQEEFFNAIQEIVQKAPLLQSSNDRIRCCEWVRKLLKMPDEEGEAVKLKNDYIQYLRLMVQKGFLRTPFKQMPPEGDLVPLPEYLVNEISDLIPELPRMGPITPVIIHRSPDGRALISAQKTGEGILCYLTVSPDGLP